MTEDVRVRNLTVPKGKVDVVLDTDAFCEVDDQFAIAYLLSHKEKLNTKAIYAAPFSSQYIDTVEEGVEKSYLEILNILNLTGEKADVFRGSKSYLPDEETPVLSDAANDLAKRAEEYSPENPLYIIGIGAITNVASAILMNPNVSENCVLVWLGGNAHTHRDNFEYNMLQDVAAARVVYKSEIPIVQLPCEGVVSAFTLSRPELEAWFFGKNELTNYLTQIVIEKMEKESKTPYWAKTIWDVTAVAWLLNDDDRFMSSRIVTAPLPAYDDRYSLNPDGKLIRYVYEIKKDNLLTDLIEKLTK